MISVYADGSSSGGASKPGGYGWIIVRGEEILCWGYGGSPATTNNLMEAEGAIQGLRTVIGLGLETAGEKLELVSDSQYVLGIASAAYAPSKNLDQARLLRALAREAGVSHYRWVRGHSGDNFNEKCDALAHQGKIENTPASILQKRVNRRQQHKAARKAIADAE